MEGCIARLGRVKKETFQERCEERKGKSHAGNWGNDTPWKKPASAKVRRRVRSLHVQGIARNSVFQSTLSKSRK